MKSFFVWLLCNEDGQELVESDQFRVAASKVSKLPIETRILFPDKFGADPIYRFNGEQNVFFDGRSDLYGAEFLKRWVRLAQLRTGWRTQIDEFGYTGTHLRNDYSLPPVREAWGGKRLYRDETATLLAS